ncbi:FERM, RhoGEF and pleckstrin domain-containing protein 1-like protein, partial [Lates japonicus]
MFQLLPLDGAVALTDSHCHFEARISREGAGQCSVQRTMAELEPDPMASGAGQRLGAPETLGISTLDPGHRPPAMPPGRHVTIRVRMLDDTEELFDIS